MIHDSDCSIIIIPPPSADTVCDPLGGLKAENAVSAGSDGRFINLWRRFCPCRSLLSTRRVFIEPNGGVVLGLFQQRRQPGGRMYNNRVDKRVQVAERV